MEKGNIKEAGTWWSGDPTSFGLFQGFFLHPTDPQFPHYI